MWLLTAPSLMTSSSAIWLFDMPVAMSDFPDLHPRLALDHGLAVHGASLRWAEHTTETLAAAPVHP